MTDEINLDDVMTRRFDLDEQASILMGKHKLELAPLIEEMKLCESFIKAELLKSGAQQWKSASTGHQTFWTTKDSVTVDDWDTVLAYIKANNAYELLNHAVSKTVVKEMIEAQTPPPGVKYVSFKDLAWRRGRV